MIKYQFWFFWWVLGDSSYLPVGWGRRCVKDNAKTLWCLSNAPLAQGLNPRTKWRFLARKILKANWQAFQQAIFDYRRVYGGFPKSSTLIRWFPSEPFLNHLFWDILGYGYYSTPIKGKTHFVETTSTISQWQFILIQPVEHLFHGSQHHWMPIKQIICCPALSCTCSFAVLISNNNNNDNDNNNIIYQRYQHCTWSYISMIIYLYLPNPSHVFQNKSMKRKPKHQGFSSFGCLPDEQTTQDFGC